MNLNEALIAISAQLSLHADSLIEYAAEDEIGGWPGGIWPGGSMWSVEGKTLYAIVRAIMPTYVLELGTREGCSATHLLSALKANDKGYLTSVDLCSIEDISGAGFGGLVPSDLHDRWTFRYPVAAQDFLDTDDTPWQIAFEDTDHTVETSVEILTRLKARQSVHTIISHDLCHPESGPRMRTAWEKVFGPQGRDWQAYCIEPSDCGLGIWRRK